MTDWQRREPFLVKLAPEVTKMGAMELINHDDFEAVFVDTVSTLEILGHCGLRDSHKEEIRKKREHKSQLEANLIFLEHMKCEPNWKRKLYNILEKSGELKNVQEKLLGNTTPDSSQQTPVNRPDSSQQASSSPEPRVSFNTPLKDISAIFTCLRNLDLHDGWHELADEFGLSLQETRQVEVSAQQHRCSYSRILLDSWMEKNGENATIGGLMEKLRKISRIDVLEEVEKKTGLSIPRDTEDEVDMAGAPQERSPVFQNSCPSNPHLVRRRAHIARPLSSEDSFDTIDGDRARIGVHPGYNPITKNVSQSINQAVPQRMGGVVARAVVAQNVSQPVEDESSLKPYDPCIGIDNGPCTEMMQDIEINLNNRSKVTSPGNQNGQTSSSSAITLPEVVQNYTQGLKGAHCEDWKAKTTEDKSTPQVDRNEALSTPSPIFCLQPNQSDLSKTGSSQRHFHSGLDRKHSKDVQNKEKKVEDLRLVDENFDDTSSHSLPLMTGRSSEDDAGQRFHSLPLESATFPQSTKFPTVFSGHDKYDATNMAAGVLSLSPDGAYGFQEKCPQVHHLLSDDKLLEEIAANQDQHQYIPDTAAGFRRINGIHHPSRELPEDTDTGQNLNDSLSSTTVPKSILTIPRSSDVDGPIRNNMSPSYPPSQGAPWMDQPGLERDLGQTSNGEIMNPADFPSSTSTTVPKYGLGNGQCREVRWIRTGEQNICYPPSINDTSSMISNEDNTAVSDQSTDTVDKNLVTNDQKKTWSVKNVVAFIFDSVKRFNHI